MLKGARVVVADYDAAAGANTVALIRQAGGEATFIQADVSNATDVEKMVKTAIDTYGRLDILVNNAGIYTKGDVVNTAESDWDRIMNVNLKGVFLCSKHAHAAMKNTGGGVIVNVASEAGSVAIKNPSRLQRLQERCHRPDQKHRRGFRGGQYPRQLHLPRYDRDASG